VVRVLTQEIVVGGLELQIKLFETLSADGHMRKSVVNRKAHSLNAIADIGVIGKRRLVSRDPILAVTYGTLYRLD
jgi:hypothetical protein